MEKAEEIQRKIIALAPGTNDARLAYIQLGNILDDIEHFDEAVEMYKKAGELDPTDDTAYINMGLSLKQAGKYNEARIAFQKAIKANPEKIKPRMALANLYYDQGFYDEALGEYVRILKARPDHAEAHFYLANLYHKRNQVNEAISGYREVIRLSPKDKDGEDMIFKSHLNLALLLAKMDTKSVEGLTDQDSQKIREKNFEDAITLAKKAIEMRAQDGHSYFVLGQIYFLRNEIDDTENAADMFRQTNITPGADKKLLSQGRNGLGKCYFRMGKYVEAIQEFTRALEYWPENEEATLNRKSASLRYEKELNR
jgi:tetratricopeptide (TPR) repeat protein